MTVPQTVSVVSTAVLTTVAVIIGIQLILILQNIRSSVSRLNQVMDMAESTLQKLSRPATAVMGVLEGLKQSSKIIEVISGITSKFSSQKPPVNLTEHDSPQAR